MRRIWALALLIAAIPTAAAFVPLFAAGAAPCAMACHGSAAPGASCCLLGGDAGVTLASCPGSHNGVPPAPVCRLFPPNPPAALERPLLVEAQKAVSSAVPISRPSEPPDRVPLALS